MGTKILDLLFSYMCTGILHLRLCFKGIPLDNTSELYILITYMHSVSLLFPPYYKIFKRRFNSTINYNKEVLPYMKFKDIIYKITHDIISPATMGVFAEEVISWSTSCRCYIKSCLTVNKVLELYNHFDPEEEVPNYVSDEIIAHGFCKRYVYYFMVDVPEDTNIVYYPYIPESEHRHWINGKLAFISGPLYVYTATLCKGLNIFCIEKFTEGIPDIRIQIKEDSQNLLLSLTENNYWYESNRFEIIHNKHIQNGEPFQFNLIPLDLINLDFDSVITMEIRAGEQGIILYKQELSFKESYAIDLSFIPNMNENACERLYVYFSTKNKKGETVNKRTYLFRHSIDTNYISLLIEKASNLLNSVEVPRLIKDEISYYLQVMTDQMTYFYFGVQLKRIVEAYENGDSLNCLITQPGPHNIYYYSEINKNYHHYYLVLPPNYNPHKKYPLLLTFQYGHVNNYEPCDKYVRKNLRIYCIFCFLLL